MLEFQNTKTFLLKDTPKIVRRSLLSAKLKILFRGLILLLTLMVNQLQEIFMKKNCKKQIKKISE